MCEHFPRLLERRTQLAGTLSGGEQQMLAIGRALMGKPKLLLVGQNARASLAISDRASVLETGQVGLSGPAAERAVNPELSASSLGG